MMYAKLALENVKEIHKRLFDIYCHSDGVYIYVLCFPFHFQQLL